MTWTNPPRGTKKALGRKSVKSEKGDSIKNQLAKCREYVKLTAKNDEEMVFVEYKDEGFTGANTFRPGFQKLVRDIEQGKIDKLICYRLDRITRSVADFSDINKRLEKYNVSFASVNESFDTSTPMGRAMLQIIIVFVQLERETIRERITDNMFGLAKTERVIGGKAPLGYNLDRYEVEGTKKKLEEWIISVGSHPGIIGADTWLEAQSIMQENKDKFPRAEKSHTALVSSILRCTECGSRMAVQYRGKTPDGGQSYYYACKKRRKSKSMLCSNKNARADLVDQAVINELKNRGLSKDLFLSNLREQLKENRTAITLNPVDFIKSDIDKKSKELTRLLKRVSETDNRLLSKLST